MEILISVVDGFVAIVQSIIFGAVTIVCFFIVMRYKSKKQEVATPVAEPEIEEEEEFLDLGSGELITKTKGKK